MASAIPGETPDEGRRFAEALERAKLDSLKELAYGASHEINNPLANIALRAQALLKREEDPDKRRALEAMHRGAMRAHEMISDLMLFARPPRLNRQSIDLLGIVREVINELHPVAERLGAKLILRDPARRPLEVTADPEQMAVAVRAVIDNALEAVGQGGQVEVVCRVEALSGVEIRIDDDGPGIPSAIRPHVFDPFFSGREAGRGLGFGLSKCWRIVTDHGGEVVLSESPLGGVSACLRLPAEATAPRESFRP
ncbi:sensor histidine kinase [Botrimarina hoheduenensis]|uniref:sensor histidine kinase n=1 Tax=Botrimarina hoheduenensis TaxID=2528000 RepID=UPI0018D46FB8|nr:HAMP domain-containing sensor histidine kinase [Botrimarina hoheduenensis]